MLSMLTVDQAQDLACEGVATLPPRRKSLLKALGCVLADPLVASINSPPFDNSAMDGYAVIAADTAGATANAPRRLRLIEELPAGSVANLMVKSGTATRIMTGAPLPPGADAVVMVEATRSKAEWVEVLHAVSPEENVRRTGEDILLGEVALPAGQRLGPGEIGLAASLGFASVRVIPPPRVAIITTGTELIEVGKSLLPGSIYNSNQALLSALVLEEGARVIKQLHVPDEEAALEKALRACVSADLILTAGGVSVGPYDFVKTTLAQLGEISLWKVRMKPGKPVAIGRLFGRPFFGLPGNPVSCLVTFTVLVAPALRKMAGRKDFLPFTVEAKLAREVSHKLGRREFIQAETSFVNGVFVASPRAKRGSAMLSAALGANSLVVLPEDCPGLAKGEKASVILLRLPGKTLDK